MKLFRERLLARLVEKKAVSQEMAMKLLSWRHPGFSVHVGEPIPPDDPKAVEDMAGYVVRNPLSLKRLVYIDGLSYTGRSSPIPSLGATSSPWTRWNGWRG